MLDLWVDLTKNLAFKNKCTIFVVERKALSNLFKHILYH